jgi:hypothetical protein
MGLALLAQALCHPQEPEMSEDSLTIRVFRVDGRSVDASDRAAIIRYVSGCHYVDSDRLGPLYTFMFPEFGTVMTNGVEGVEIYLSPGGSDVVQYAQLFVQVLEANYDGVFLSELYQEVAG